MKKIAVVEDNPDNRLLVQVILEPLYEVTEYEDGFAALAGLPQARPDLVLLDVSLPGMDGPEVLRKLREEHAADVPVIMLTARDELPDKIAGFRAGADDYLTKPFALPELEVRLEALVTRAKGRGRARVLEVQDLRLDLGTLEASRAGKPLHLYPACRKLLEVLMQASPGAVTRERLEYALWGDSPPDGDMLRSHIYELRRSVDGPFPVKLIQTLPRVGYRLATHAEDTADNA